MSGDGVKGFACGCLLVVGVLILLTWPISSFFFRVALNYIWYGRSGLW